MIRPIMKSELVLSRPSSPATADDRQVGLDLLDTLAHHRDECVGMAANMINVQKRIIVFTDSSGNDRLMFNPEITVKKEPFNTQEGCLSLQGFRPTKRFKQIAVRFEDIDGKMHTEKFSGWTAQIIQHEIDHCDGIII